MTENEAIEIIKYASAFNSDNSPLTKALEVAIQALEEIQQYRAIETELREQYHANVDIKMLMQHFIETIFKGEKHEGFCILTNEDAKMWDAYKAIGTVENVAKLKELYDKAKWLLDDERKKRRSFETIGTIEEFKALKEKTTPKRGIPYTSSNNHKFVECPSCHKNMDLYYDFCQYCGQAVDWGKTKT